MKKFLFLIFIFPLHLFSQTFEELDLVLKIENLKFSSNEIRVYKKYSTSTGLELFRFYQDKNDIWKADLYQTVAKKNIKNEIEIKIRKEKLNSFKNLELIWFQITNSDILFLPKFDNIEYKLKHRNKDFEIIDGEFSTSSTETRVLDGETYFVKIKNENKYNEIIYPNSNSYLKLYPEIDELLSFQELLDIIKKDFRIFTN